MKEHLTYSLVQTKNIGKSMAKEAISFPLKNGALVIGLQGELGAGKTSFAQGFAAGLGIKEKILSPTFVIQKSYDIPREASFKKLYHIDAYRIGQEQELLELGWNTIIRDSKNIVLVEWADRVEGILPKDVRLISFESLDLKTRRVKLL